VLCETRRSLLGLGTDALEGAVVLGPAGEGGLDEVRALLGHVCRDAPGHALELAAHILGAHSGLVELALFEIERHNTYSSVVTYHSSLQSVSNSIQTSRLTAHLTDYNPEKIFAHSNQEIFEQH